jgi:hypothetical protein
MGRSRDYSLTPGYGSNSGFGFNSQKSNMIGGGIGSVLSGLFNDSSAPYGAAMDQYKKYFDQANQTQQPFYNAGTQAIPQYQDFLKQMQNPSGFINNLMGQYQESPYAHYQQLQAQRAAQNYGSANGLTGSTPLMQQAQQNASNISSGDMNNWLNNVLGVNTQYGQGIGNLIQGGQGSANALTDLLSKYGELMGQGAYNEGAAENNDFSNLLGGIGNIASALMFL